MVRVYYTDWIIIDKINKNISRNGNKTNIHAMFVEPDLHIKFKIQVQNNIYISFTTNTNVVLVTSQLKLPRQYTFLLPIFCIDAINTKTSEIAK